MANKTTSEIEHACKGMLKAAAVMPGQQGIAHTKEQAGLIYDQFHEPLSVAELELLDAQKELDRLSQEMEKLRRERRRYDEKTGDTPPTEKEENNGKTTT